MFRLTLCLAAGLALSAAAYADSTDDWLTRPADPTLKGKPLRYAPVTAGVKRFRVVEPKDWMELNRAAGAPGGHAPRASGMKGTDHSTMPGMDHQSMPGMKIDGGSMQ